MVSIEKLKEALAKVKADETLDAETRQLYATALEAKIKTETRSGEAKTTRAIEKLFLLHFSNGCPQCQHSYRPSPEEIENYLRLREASNMKLGA